MLSAERGFYESDEETALSDRISIRSARVWQIRRQGREIEVWRS